MADSTHAAAHDRGLVPRRHGRGTLLTDGHGLHRVTAVVPVKPLVLAKSRLALDDDERAALALAFATDTVSALLDCALVADVLVVTSDEDVVRRMRHLGVGHVPDEGPDLDGAVRCGVRAVTRWSTRTGVVVVPADLPCLHPADVVAVLASAPGTGGAFVPDRSGTGTTMVVHPPSSPVVTSYGPGSARRHRSLGLLALDEAPLGARHDVDTLDDLRSAAELGTGTATRAVMAALDLDVDLDLSVR